MKVKIKSTEFPFYGKYQENQLITFDYFGKECSAIVTKKARDFFKIHHLQVNREIEVIKNIKNNKICYIVRKLYT